ncbi:hypothetical protein BDQ12DRAFT_683631 [Crucibulum laeve]|uniref:Uncharacterized protein n=1 Tax=Crucibulum laeve TaxID=68775 RepID=A0A5C3LZ80_9AGAR|nr:hypothetical protein BDQ12DRAFT_683631 [Crucibulum laeve]
MTICTAFTSIKASFDQDMVFPIASLDHNSRRCIHGVTVLVTQDNTAPLLHAKVDVVLSKRIRRRQMELLRHALSLLGGENGFRWVIRSIYYHIHIQTSLCAYIRFTVLLDVESPSCTHYYELIHAIRPLRLQIGYINEMRRPVRTQGCPPMIRMRGN